MQPLVILPGNSARNQELLDTYEKYYQDKYDVITVPWGHWKNDSVINIHEEIERIAGMFEGPKKDITVVAKSVGTVIFSYALNNIDLKKLKKVIFLGVPLGDSDLQEFSEKYKNLRNLNDIKLFVVQEKEDPYGSFDKIKILFEKYIKSNAEVLPVEGDSHSYLVEEVSKLGIL
ncbi:hypothetical protein JW766_01890 [Candidatus Dojkabacteria bacterium]|nr:hypothetical protein [Candidatus Dojkabacteria bacterium]